jgi:hypothetical protein
MGKPITEAVYLRDIQRQCLAWMKEFRDDKNKGMASLVEQSTANRNQTEANDQAGRSAVNKVGAQIQNYNTI